MAVDLEKLEEQIQKLKKELNVTAKSFGINSKKTIGCSQKLDQLIVTYQKNTAHGIFKNN